MIKPKKQNKSVVLLIEDEEDTAALMTLHLEQSGLSVVQARDGRQAVDIMEDIAPPSVVLLDVVVPYLNGFELLNIIRTKPGWEQVPVMVVSGDSDKGDMARMLREGAHDYIVKSWGVGVMHHRLQQLLGQGPERAGRRSDARLAPQV